MLPPPPLPRPPGGGEYAPPGVRREFLAPCSLARASCQAVGIVLPPEGVPSVTKWGLQGSPHPASKQPLEARAVGGGRGSWPLEGKVELACGGRGHRGGDCLVERDGSGG